VSNQLPAELFRKWQHSFEEDGGDFTVYRPNDFDFPRARGRAGIEILDNGVFIDWAIGRGDAQTPIRGQWTMEQSCNLKVSFPPGGGRDRTIEIVECSKTMLRTRVKIQT
jgi:hypothetical protein